MNIFKKYNEYLKNNPEGYWFKRKLYGWGWTPAKTEGWIVLLIFILLLMWNGLSISSGIPTQAELTWFAIRTFILIGAVIFICYKTGEKPRWQWGPTKK